MQTTEMYTRVDPAVKLEALESVVPPTLRFKRYRQATRIVRGSHFCADQKDLKMIYRLGMLRPGSA
jgi:hypothetical protein